MNKMDRWRQAKIKHLMSKRIDRQYREITWLELWLVCGAAVIGIIGLWLVAKHLGIL